MKQLRKRRKDIEQPSFPQFQAKVHIIQGNCEILVQPAHRNIQALLYHQAGAGHRCHILCIAQAPHIAKVLAVLLVMDMSGSSVGPQADDHTGMLNGFVRIVKLRPYCPHVPALGIHQQLLHPIHGDDFRIVI